MEDFHRYYWGAFGAILVCIVLYKKCFNNKITLDV